MRRARLISLILTAATGIACGAADSEDLGEGPVAATSGVDASLTTDALTTSQTQHLCAWSVRTLGGEGTTYDAPCIADAPDQTVTLIVLSSPECVQRLVAYEHAAYTVGQFETCSHAFVEGRCGGGCIGFSIELE